MIHTANSSLRVVSIVQGYHVYKDGWNPDMVFTFHLLILQGTVQLDDAFSGFVVKFGDSDKIGVHAHNNFSDKYLETFPSKHC